MAIVGYARVSTIGQRLDVQLEQLEAAGCEKIYREKVSGTTAARPQLTACLDFLREGDTLVITKIDRLARSMTHFCKIVDELQADGVELKILNMQVDTTTPQGRLFLHMMGGFAEFETAIRAERQAEGIAKAQENGVKFGRPVSLSVEQVESLKKRRRAGEPIKALMTAFKLSKASVYRYLDGVTAE